MDIRGHLLGQNEDNYKLEKETRNLEQKNRRVPVEKTLRKKEVGTVSK